MEKSIGNSDEGRAKGKTTHGENIQAADGTAPLPHKSWHPIQGGHHIPHTYVCLCQT